MSQRPDVPPPAEPYRYAAPPASSSGTAAAATGPQRWSAGRTAAVAGVTIVLVSAGAITAAAVVPLGGSGRASGTSQGGFPGGGRPPGLQNGPGQQHGFGRQDGAQLPNLPDLGRTTGPATGDTGTTT
ncbi:hypothetical protein [Intrasporangium sp.]|uniref:hypothetical protein n=1 Tax=Intrasporangium sp. TaxID=1925024 RepID=UPI0032219582